MTYTWVLGLNSEKLVNIWGTLTRKPHSHSGEFAFEESKASAVMLDDLQIHSPSSTLPSGGPES